MKISDYKLSEYLKNNPEAESIPVNEIKEDEVSAENQITLEDVIKHLGLLEDQIKSMQAKPEPSEDKTKSDKDTSDKIDALTEEVKQMKEEAQKKAQADSTLPEPESADDILTKFLTGGI